LYNIEQITMASPTSDDDLRNSISSMITGVEDGATSSGSSGTPYDDDLTPFPSPVLSATSLAGLSREWLQYSICWNKLMYSGI